MIHMKYLHLCTFKVKSFYSLMIHMKDGVYMFYHNKFNVCMIYYILVAYCISRTILKCMVMCSIYHLSPYTSVLFCVCMCVYDCVCVCVCVCVCPQYTLFDVMIWYYIAIYSGGKV